jgi:hypothetical protein
MQGGSETRPYATSTRIFISFHALPGFMSSVQAHLAQTDDHDKAKQEKKEHAEGQAERQSGKDPTMADASAGAFIFMTAEGVEIGTATTRRSYGKHGQPGTYEE